jgi:hypothetical protein
MYALNYVDAPPNTVPRDTSRLSAAECFIRSSCAHKPDTATVTCSHFYQTVLSTKNWQPYAETLLVWYTYSRTRRAGPLVLCLRFVRGKCMKWGRHVCPCDHLSNDSADFHKTWGVRRAGSYTETGGVNVIINNMTRNLSASTFVSTLLK